MEVGGDVTGVHVERGVPFATPRDVDLRANVFRPSGDPAGWRTTAIVHVHGGVWNRGERTFFDDRCRAMAERGFPAATVDYRLAPEATYPAAVRDVETAVRWARATDAVSERTDRVVLVGHSAGAHLSALVAATAHRTPAGDRPGVPDDGFGDASAAPDGVVCFDGPYDLMGAEPGGETAQFVGCEPTEDPELYREASPRERADASHPPALLYHAADDEWLTRRETRAYRDVLACHGVDVDLHTPPGDHFFFADAPWFERTVEHTVDLVDAL